MVNKYLSLLTLALLVSCSSQKLPERSPEFEVSPLLLLKSDQSVVRDYDVNLHIHSEDNATYKVRKSMTVMSPDARDEGTLILPYGGFQEISSVEGALYSKNGTLIRRLTEEDGMDLSLTDFSLYSDTRIKVYEFYYHEYPYTIVYDYEVEYSGLLNLPDFSPQSRNEYVEEASLKVKTPKNLGLNHRSFNFDVRPEKSFSETDSIFTWQLKELAPIKIEPFGRSFYEMAPRVLLATESFEIAGTKGKMNSWNSFGEWYYSLSQGRDELPEDVKKEVKEIFESSPSREIGIKNLFEYMQDKTRYISVQLGIGGWQPFEANYVESKGYGDCKALTNYMYSILKYAGVESHPVLINNGIAEPDIVTDFPSNQFNHVVLWIPGENPIWLESTSQSIPFNYLGFSNSDRHGLAVTPDSSFLIKTPVYDHQVNNRNNNLVLNIDDQGHAEIDGTATYSGYYLDQLLGAVAKKSEAGRHKWMHEELTLNSFEIQSADFSDIDKKKRAPSLNYTIYNPRYATKTGSRLFIPVNKLNKWDYDFPEPEEGGREEEVDLKFTFAETDQSIVTIPKGFEVEALPGTVNLDTGFGFYSMKAEVNENNKIEIIRTLKIAERFLPAEKYTGLWNFFSKVSEADNKNIVLRSN